MSGQGWLASLPRCVDVRLLTPNSTDGSIRIDYGYAKSEGRKAFYTRQITFPVLFTVYNMFELHDLDLLRLSAGDVSQRRSSSNSGPATQETTPSRKPSLAPLQNGRPRRASSFGLHAEDTLIRVLRDESDDAHCLLDLSVSNVYGIPFEVCLSRTIDDDGKS